MDSKVNLNFAYVQHMLWSNLNEFITVVCLQLGSGFIVISV